MKELPSDSETSAQDPSLDVIFFFSLEFSFSFCVSHRETTFLVLCSDHEIRGYMSQTPDSHCYDCLQEVEEEILVLPHSDVVEGPLPMEGKVLEIPTLKFTWTIPRFGNLVLRKIYSDVFEAGGYKW